MTGESDPSSAPPIPFDDDVAWRAWTPTEAADRLDGVRTAAGERVRWAVAGGWALDLFLGRTTRAHEDLEIVVLGDDVPSVLAAFAGPDWRWLVPTDGWLHPLASPAYGQTHQTWLWAKRADAFVLDVFRDRHAGDTWICRRDPSITMPWTTAQATAHLGRDIPYLAPEIVLLFKAKHARPKDLGDLRTTLPALDADRRDWLRAAIDRVHPGHEWLTTIAGCTDTGPTDTGPSDTGPTDTARPPTPGPPTPGPPTPGPPTPGHRHRAHRHRVNRTAARSVYRS